MNKGAVQRSTVHQMTAPGWWSIKIPSLLVDDLPCQQMPPPPMTVTAASWSPEEPPDESFSQLLLGGLFGQDDKFGLRNLDNWEQFILNQAPDSTCNHFSSSGEDVEFPAGKGPTLSQQAVTSASTPKSFSSAIKVKDFSSKSSDLNNPSECDSTSSATGGVAKKAKIQASSPQSSSKVRKEKLGDRITALHQLVSPFGKTDTASVLLESIGYIRFLQSQIEALSLPYLGRKSGTLGRQFHESDDGKDRKDLKNRGLCLVPLSCTLHVGSDNGADYWAPAFGANFH